MGATLERVRAALQITEAQKAAATARLGEALAAELRTAAPGKLGASVQWHQDSSTSGRITMAGVARYVVEGHGAYDIVPRNKQALYWKGARHPVKRVHMPAKAPNDFVAHVWQSAALDAARLDAGRLLLSGVYRIAGRH